eukprot:scaffold2073_cov107-Cylindrotheca_fusiformis.AAC.3
MAQTATTTTTTTTTTIANSSSDGVADSSSTNDNDVSIVPDELTCHICQELYCAAVSISKCQHSYCSHCIRMDFYRQLKSLKSWVCCPTCRADLFPRGISKVEQVLQPNLKLQQQVYDYQCQQLGYTAAAASSAASNSSSSSSSSGHQGKPLTPHPPVVYQGKKRKDLVLMLSNQGLPTEGTETELKSRYERFVLCWNSFCDERINPPSDEFVKRYFVSKIINRKKNNKQKKKKKTSCYSNPEQNNNDEHDNYTNRFRKEFQDLYSKIRQDHVTRTTKKKKKTSIIMDSRFKLALLAIQRHSILQDPNIRTELRNRAMNMDYGKPISWLSQVLQEEEEEKVSNNTSLAKETENQPTQDYEDGRPPSCEPTPTHASDARNKRAATRATRSTSKAVSVSPAASTTTNTSTSTTHPRVVVGATTNTPATTAATTAQPPPPPAVTPMAKRKEGSTSGNKRTTPDSSSGSVTPTTTAARSTFSSESASSVKPARTVTVVTTATVPIVQQSSRTYKKPRTTTTTNATQSSSSWPWTCQICMYEMRMDRTATHCAFCGTQKGKTFDQVHQENTIQQRQKQKTTSLGSSRKNPIQMLL